MIDVTVIRVITLETQDEAAAHARLIAQHAPMFSYCSICIPDQPTGVHDPDSHAAAAAKVVKLGVEAAKTSRAIVVSCVDDPGVVELRSLVDVPVIGAGEALSARAAGAGLLGLVNLNEDVPRPLRGADWRITQLFPYGGVTTVDLDRTPVREFYLRGVKGLVAAGAERILAACTGMDASGLTPELSAAAGMTVESPLSAVAHELTRVLTGTAGAPTGEHHSEGEYR